MYVYFDNTGTLKTKINHGEVLRQGSDLNLTVCFSPDYAASKGTNWDSLQITASIMLENGVAPIASQTAEMPLLYETFYKANDSEVTYDLVSGKQYEMCRLSWPHDLYPEITNQAGNIKIGVQVNKVNWTYSHPSSYDENAVYYQSENGGYVKVPSSQVNSTNFAEYYVRSAGTIAGTLINGVIVGFVEAVFGYMQQPTLDGSTEQYDSLHAEDVILQRQINKNANDITDLSINKQNVVLSEDTLRAIASVIVSGNAPTEVEPSLVYLFRNVFENHNINVEQNDRLDNAETQIEGLWQSHITGIRVVSTMTTTDRLPTQEELSAEVAKAGLEPSNGNVIYIREIISGGTDLFYIATYNVTTELWTITQIQYLESANNSNKGIIQGSANDTTYHQRILFDIFDGKIVDALAYHHGTWISLRWYLDKIEAILDGNLAVPKAIGDEDGSNIKSTYMTQIEGASKDYVQGYAAPKILNDMYYFKFIKTGGYVAQDMDLVEKNIDNDMNREASVGTVGDNLIAVAHLMLNQDLVIGNKNGMMFSGHFQFNNSIEGRVKVVVEYQRYTSLETHILGAERTDSTAFAADTVYKVDVNTLFSELTDDHGDSEPITLHKNDYIHVKLYFYTESTSTTRVQFIANSTYKSIAFLDKQTYVQYLVDTNDYNQLYNKPIINKDLSAVSDVTTLPAYTVYRHIGNTTQNGSLIQGMLYFKKPNGTAMTPIWEEWVEGAQFSNGDAIPRNGNTLVVPMVTPNFLPFSNLEDYTDDNPTLGSNNLVYSNGVARGLVEKTDLSNIAPDYSDQSTYDLGDLVIYNGNIYKCTTAIDTAEEWTAAHWTQKTIEELIAEKTVDLSNYVDKTSAQTISGKKTFSGAIITMSGIGMSDAGNRPRISWSIGPNSVHRMEFFNTDFKFNGSIVPYDGAAVTHGTFDFGTSSNLWRNLYLSGNLSDGTNGISVANIANKNEIDLIYEKTANKVTTISGSSTDTQYPSAKAVHDFVNSSIASNTAYFVGTFATVSDLEAYSGTLTNNDYANVTNSERDFSSTSDMNAFDKTLLTNFDYGWIPNGSKYDLYRFDISSQTWGLRATNINKGDVQLVSAYNRYVYNASNTTWSWNYTINASGLTAAQFAALNSGIDTTKVSAYDSHIANTSNPHNVTAAQVGALPVNTPLVSSLNGQTGAITGIATTSNLATKLDKVTGVTTHGQCYGKNANGTQEMFDFSPDGDPLTIPTRDSNGNIAVALTPVFNDDAASKSYVDSKTGSIDTSGKLDKVTGTTTYGQAYVKNADGTQAMIDATANVVSSAIVERDSNGDIIVPATPTATAAATPKSYVDDGLADKLDKTDPTGTGSFSLNRAANTTVGSYSFAEGRNTTASGNVSHAEGYNTTANEQYSHAEGLSSVASGNVSHAEGNGTTASGNSSHTEGYETTASGDYTHAEGRETTASGSYSHAEGGETTASGPYSHAEGYNTNASDGYTHAEGRETTASGIASHAEGSDTIASAHYTHAEGQGTIAQRRSQHVFGEYNIADTSGIVGSIGAYIEIVGNGSSSTRSNARTLDWNGNEVLAGGLTIGANATLSDGTNSISIANIMNKNKIQYVTALPASPDSTTFYFVKE